MPALDVYSMGDTITTLRLEESTTPPTMTVTISSGHAEPSGGSSTGGSAPLGSGVTAAIVVVSVLVGLCAVVAARLHLWWCAELECRVCVILTCGRRKPQKEKGV